MEGVDKMRARTGGLADADWRTRTDGRGLVLKKLEKYC